jgi:serine/threonine-protein kinase
MAPEQVAKGSLTPATVIYALGAVAYHCIAGRPPFDGDNALQVALRHLEDEPDPLPDHVPYEVRDLIARAMAKQPADRFQSASEFAEAAFATAGPLDWKRMTGTSLVAPVSPARLGTGQFPTAPLSAARPMSPAAPTTPISPISPAVPRPRTAPPPRPSPPARGRPPAGQRILMIAILALFALAGGLGLIFTLSKNGEPTGNPRQAEVQETTPAPETSDEFEEPVVEPTSQITSKRPSRSRSPSPKPTETEKSPSPTATKTPTSDPATSEPTTEPTTTAPTTQPTTTAPTTEPTDPQLPGGIEEALGG